MGVSVGYFHDIANKNWYIILMTGLLDSSSTTSSVAVTSAGGQSTTVRSYLKLYLSVHSHSNGHLSFRQMSCLLVWTLVSLYPSSLSSSRCSSLRTARSERRIFWLGGVTLCLLPALITVLRVEEHLYDLWLLVLLLGELSFSNK